MVYEYGLTTTTNLNTNYIVGTYSSGNSFNIGINTAYWNLQYCNHCNTHYYSYLGHNCSHSCCGCNCLKCGHSCCTCMMHYWSLPEVTVIEKYRVRCPECKKLAWVELDKETKHTCGAILKAVTKKPKVIEIEIDDEDV